MEKKLRLVINWLTVGHDLIFFALCYFFAKIQIRYFFYQKPNFWTLIRLLPQRPKSAIWVRRSWLLKKWTQKFFVGTSLGLPRLPKKSSLVIYLCLGCVLQVLNYARLLSNLFSVGTKSLHQNGSFLLKCKKSFTIF